MSLLITDAGIAAATAAGDLGVSYKIAYISVGTEGYIPTVGQTELKNEVARVEITKGFDNGNGQLHGEGVFDGDNEFVGKELGYHLTDGTLFAVDSRAGEIISVKRSNTIVTEAFDLNLANSSIDNITVAITGVTAATDEDIDNKAQTKRMVLLPQLWRALQPIRDRANEALNVAHSKWTYVQASLTTYGATKLSSAINSTSESLSATPKAVKLVADIANSKMTQATADSRYVSKSQVSSSTTSTSTTNVANSKAVSDVKKRADEAYNKATSASGSNAVYAGNSKTNVEFPLGTNVVYCPGNTLATKDFNKHVEVFHSTYSAHSNYVAKGYAYQGAKLNGVWGTRTRSGVLNNSAAWLVERIL